MRVLPLFGFLCTLEACSGSTALTPESSPHDVCESHLDQMGSLVADGLSKKQRARAISAGHPARTPTSAEEAEELNAIISGLQANRDQAVQESRAFLTHPCAKHVLQADSASFGAAAGACQNALERGMEVVNMSWVAAKSADNSLGEVFVLSYFDRVDDAKFAAAVAKFGAAEQTLSSTVTGRPWFSACAASVVEVQTVPSAVGNPVGYIFGKDTRYCQEHASDLCALHSSCLRDPEACELLKGMVSSAVGVGCLGDSEVPDWSNCP